MAEHAKLSLEADSVATLLPTVMGVTEGRQGALPLDLSWAQQRVPSGSLSDHSKDGGQQDLRLGDLVVRRACLSPGRA